MTPYFCPCKFTHPIAWGYKSWCDIWPIRALSLRIRWTSPPTARSLQWRRNSRVFKINWWRSCVQTFRFLLFKLLYLARRQETSVPLNAEREDLEVCVEIHTYLNFRLFCHGKTRAPALAFFLCEVRSLYVSCCECLCNNEDILSSLLKSW